MSLTLLVHGESGQGKSWLGDTAPGPRLILDVEGGCRFTPSHKTPWDPRTAPPAREELKDDDSVVVRVLDFGTLNLVVQWLRSGEHPFKSVVLDSVTEAQARCLANISGTNLPETQDWGRLLIQMTELVVNLRDLVDHPTNPLDAVVLIAGCQDKAGTIRPHVQGQLALKLPYYMDVVGYLYSQDDGEGALRRFLLVEPRQPFVAKDRTGRLGAVVADPTVPKLLEAVSG